MSLIEDVLYALESGILNTEESLYIVEARDEEYLKKKIAQIENTVENMKRSGSDPKDISMIELRLKKYYDELNSYKNPPKSNSKPESKSNHQSNDHYKSTNIDNQYNDPAEMAAATKNESDRKKFKLSGKTKGSIIGTVGGAGFGAGAGKIIGARQKKPIAELESKLKKAKNEKEKERIEKAIKLRKFMAKHGVKMGAGIGALTGGISGRVISSKLSR